MLTIHTKVWLEADGHFAVGEGGLELLRAIDDERSLSRAAIRVGWSYKHAWAYLRNAEHTLQTALTKTRPGKGLDRGTMLTTSGKFLMQALGRARDQAHLAARRGWKGTGRRSRDTKSTPSSREDMAVASR